MSRSILASRNAGSDGRDGSNVLTQSSEIVERFRRIHRDTPARPLIHLPVEGRSLTADDLWAAALTARRALEDRRIGADHLLLLAAGNRAAAFDLWLASRMLGCAVMPVDAGATPAELAALARRFGASMALVPDHATDLGSLGVPEPFHPGIAAVRIAGARPAPEIHGGAAALKLTSGSTGLPKATFTTERQLVIDTEHILTAMGIGPDDTQIAAIPLSHAYGLGNLLIGVLLQGTPVVLREGFVPHQLTADARAYGARAFPGVPFMFDHLAANPAPGGWPPGLRTLVSAGARLEASTVSRFFETFGVKIHSFYGTSETGGIAYDDSEDISPAPTVGRPMPDVTITLRPEEGAPDGSGRVHVASEAVSSGYAGATAADEGFAGGGFLTGDFGRFEPNGHLLLTGRASLFINVAGRKVQPEEVEQVLRQMPSVRDVRVLGAADPARGQQIVACVVPRDGDRNVLTVRQFCAARLAPYKIPRIVIWLPDIPLTERGKTDRARLDAIVREHVSRTSVTGVL